MNKRNIKYFLCLLSLICLSLASCNRSNKDEAQEGNNDKTDSISIALNKAKEYYAAGKANQQKAILDSIAPMMAEMENGTEKQKEEYLEYIHSRMVYYAQYTNLTDSMIYYGKKAKEYSFKIGDHKSAILSISNLADVYRQSGDINKAILEYDNGIRLNDSIQADSALYLPMYSGMACSFNVLHNKVETMKWLDKMTSMSKWMTLIDSVSYYNQKGNCLYFAEDYRGSLNVFLQMDSLLHHHPDMSFERIVCDVNLADDYIHLKENNKVGSLLDNALDYFQKNGIEAYVPYVHTLQIKHLLNMGRYSEALRFAESVKGEIPSMYIDHRIARLQVMSLCMHYNGKDAEAIKYGSLYSQLNDSLRNEQTMATTSEIESRYAQDALTKESQIKMQEKELREMALYIMIAGLVAVILFIGVIFMYWIHRGHLQRDASLNKIISLRGEIIRNRLTPHFISNALALGHNLSPDDIDHIILLIRESLAYGNELETPLEKELTLAKSYLYVASLMYQGKLITEYDIDDSIDISKIYIPAMALLTIIENAVKHGSPDNDNCMHISVSLKDQGDRICLQVENPGHLYDYSTNHDKAWHGLQMIHQMVSLLNEKGERLDFRMEEPQQSTVRATICIKKLKS